MPNRFQHWLAVHSSWILLITAAITLLALLQLVDFRNATIRLTIDPSLDAVSTQSQADRDYADLIRLRFGNREPVMVVLQSSDLFTLDTLTRLKRLSDKLALLDGVESISSLTASIIPRITDGILNYSRLTSADFENPELPRLLRESIDQNPLLIGQLVSTDRKSAVILVHPESQTELALLQSRLAERILSAIDTERSSGINIMVTGSPIIRSEISDTVASQLRQVIPTIIILISILLAIAFRSIRGVILPLATISIALIWTLAIISFLGQSLNLITALMPPFIITMGLAYCAHVITEFEHQIRRNSGQDQQARLMDLLQEVSIPVIITGLATIAGLLALTLNEQRSMIEFAGYSALGTALLMILTLTFVPAMLRYCKPANTLKPLPASFMFEAGGKKLMHFDQHRRPLILKIALGLFLVSLLFASQIRIGDVFVGLFSEDTRIRSDHEAINRIMGGVNPLDISIEGGSPDVFTDPGVLQSLAKLEDWLKNQPEVGAVHGLTDHVRMLNRFLADDPQGQIPRSRDVIGQMLFVGEGELLRSVINIDRSATLIQLRLNVDDTASIGQFIDRLKKQLELLPTGLTSRLMGGAVIMTESVQKATSGQLMSVALSLVMIYLFLSLQFMSLKIGLLATLPSALQTALYFGILGLLGVSLNPTSVLVECLVLGLAIDDTIHYLARFSSAAKHTGSEKAAASKALLAVLRPVTLTKAILALGFLTLVTGELSNQAVFGWLAAMTLFFAWLVDIFVTPAFMSGIRIVTLWDTLRLDLGYQVQKSIPLFRGLTQRQARIFALMSNLHTLPANTRLITEGDEAGSIYIVIDGELSVFTGTGNTKKVLKTMRRGDVVGEIGYFGQRRSASIDTLTKTRLLRFNDEDQERLCAAYPSIASRVFLSLNRLQAQRQVERYQSDPSRTTNQITAALKPGDSTISFDSDVK